jgi:hypothetical protein
MSNDLTVSRVARQNILNNRFAVEEIEKAAGLRTVEFEGRRVALKSQVSRFFGVTERSIDEQISLHSDELSKNGYEVIRGKRLKSLKYAISMMKVDELNFVDLKFSPQLGVFDFRAFINLAMLLPASERAKQLRNVILDITIDTINARSGGNTKYINQRDEDYLKVAFAGESYRKEYTGALKEYLFAERWKYPIFTDKIYEIIFKEKAREYRRILRLDEKDKTRRTFYTEIITLIAAFEHAIAVELKAESERLGEKLSVPEADEVIEKVAASPLTKPLIEMARTKMASRDFGLRGVTHNNLTDYITSVPEEDFEKFLGQESKDLAEQLEEARDVLKRLRDR